MNSRQSKSRHVPLVITEIALYVILTAVVASGILDGIVAHLQWAPVVCQIAGWSFLAATIIISKITGNDSVSLRMMTLLTLTALLITYCSSESKPFGYIPLEHSLIIFGVILWAAQAASPKPILVSSAIIIVTFTGHLISGVMYVMENRVLNEAQMQKIVWPFFMRIFYVIGAGGFVWIAGRGWKTNHFKALQKSLEAEEPAKPVNEGYRNSETRHLGTAQQTGFYSVAEISSGQTLGELLRSVVFFMSKNFRAFSALGFIYDEEKQTLFLNSYHSRSLNIISKMGIPLGQGLVGSVGTSMRPFISGDISLYGGKLFYYQQEEMINSIAAVPIKSETGELLGVLVVDSKDKNAFNDRDSENLRRFSVFASALISNVKMRKVQEQTTRQFQTLYEASQEFAHSLRINEVYNVLVPMLGRLTYSNCIMVVGHDEERQQFFIELIQGRSGDIQQGAQYDVMEGLYAFALNKKSVVNVSDMQAHRGQYYRFFPEEKIPENLRSLTIFPVLDDESKCLGLVSLECDRPGYYDRVLQNILSTLVGTASVVLKRALLYQQMERLATTDGLTSLNNHRRFQELLDQELNRADRYNRPISLLLLDIDHFKKFNDTYGHPVGDQVLREISSCIKNSVRKTDVPARYGGEEFVVIMPETTLDHITYTPERIRQTIEQHTVKNDGQDLRVTVSIGCATYPTQVKSKQELIDAADKALYVSKEQGRNRVTVFQPGMN